MTELERLEKILAHALELRLYTVAAEIQTKIETLVGKA